MSLISQMHKQSSPTTEVPQFLFCQRLLLCLLFLFPFCLRYFFIIVKSSFSVQNMQHVALYMAGQWSASFC